METQRQEFRIGIMVLACIVSLILMTFFFGRQPVINFGGEDNTIQVRFQRSPGVKRNTPVYKNGVQIGRVTRVELVENDQQVEVTINLDRRKKIYTDEECRIKQNAIMSDASLEFSKRLNYAGEVKEIDPATHPYLVGADSTDLMSGFSNIEGDLSKAIKNVADAADQLGAFVGQLNGLIGTPEEFLARQAKFEAIVNETRQTMASVRYTTDGISRFVNDPDVQSNVRKVIGDLPDVIERSRVLVGESTLFVHDTRALIEKGSLSMDNVSAGIEKIYQTLDSITNIVDQVEGDVPEIIAAVKRSAVRLESLFSELTLIVENFRNADGTVKRLLRDPEAYQKLMVTLDNVERITSEVDMMLRIDAKPIAHNVKVLTDKAARDPAIFIRNLLRKEPPIKTLPAYFGGGMYVASSFPRTMVIDGEVVEVLDEMPVSVSRTPKSSLPMPASSAGRIVNVDPRYQDAAGEANRCD